MWRVTTGVALVAVLCAAHAEPARGREAVEAFVEWLFGDEPDDSTDEEIGLRFAEVNFGRGHT